MGDDTLWRHRVGTRVGKYRIDALIGVGGMAAVFAATHDNKNRAALKFLDPYLAERGDFRARFLREGLVANTVGHEGTVAVVGDGVADDGSPYLVMELLDGEPLDAIQRRLGVLPLPEAVELLRRLLDVLAAANAKGIVHRDLKPGNLFLKRDGTLRVLDFGIARLRDGTELETTKTGSNFGTPAFMPSEQALGRTREVDGRTDLWSATATFFHLVSGEFTHHGTTAGMLVSNIASKPARSLREVAPAAPQALVDVVARALALDRTQRYADAREMKAALDPIAVALGSKGDAELAQLVARKAAVLSASEQAAATRHGDAFAPVHEAVVARVACEGCGVAVPRSDLTHSALVGGAVCRSCLIAPPVQPCRWCGAPMAKSRTAYAPDGSIVCMGCATRGKLAPSTPLIVWVVPAVVLGGLTLLGLLFALVVWSTP